MNSCPSSETKPQRRVAPCRFCQLGKWRRLNWTDVPPLQFPSRKKRMQITALALLMLTSLHYGKTYMAMQMCLIGWMNLRKVHPWTEIILVASCVRQLTTKVHIISKNQLFQFSLSMWELGLSKKSVQVIVNSQSCMSYLLEIMNPLYGEHWSLWVFETQKECEPWREFSQPERPSMCKKESERYENCLFERHPRSQDTWYNWGALIQWHAALLLERYENCLFERHQDLKIHDITRELSFNGMLHCYHPMECCPISKTLSVQSVSPVEFKPMSHSQKVVFLKN